jgi:16S rRNA processing protein RimM
MKVQLWCDSPDFFKNIKNLYFNNGNEKINLKNIRIQKNMGIIKIDGVDTPEQAVNFRNKILFIDRNDIELEEGSYFIQDLIGMKVIDADTNKEYGIIDDVSETGANDVYHIKASDGKYYYIPAIPDVVIKTDIYSNTMTIRPLKGLFDDED